MSDKINCPFCGNIIETEIKKCPSCGSLFEEPRLPGIKFQEFRTFFALEIMTFGLFGILWFFINVNAINRLCDKVQDNIKLNWLIALMILNVCGYFVYISHFSNMWAFSLFVIAQILIFMALTYRVIRIIMKHTKHVYDISLEYNPYYVVFFNIFYLIHYIDTYADRVNQIHEHFNIKSPQIIVLIILLLTLQFMCCWNSNIHMFYKWLFGF